MNYLRANKGCYILKKQTFNSHNHLNLLQNLVNCTEAGALLLLGKDRKILILSPDISKFKAPASVECPTFEFSDVFWDYYFLRLRK